MGRSVLFITNYYPPETGAAAIRIANMVSGFRKRGYEVKVVAPLPNYPSGRVFQGYKNKWIHRELSAGLEIFRLWILPSHSRNMFKRLLAMLSFGMSLSIYLLFRKKPDTIIIQSPPAGQFQRTFSPL